MRLNSFVSAAVFVCAFTLVGNAQETRGSVIGQIVDSSGAVIPAADVTVTSAESNFKQKTVTNNNGAYEFLYILPGRYTVSAVGKGFKPSGQDIDIRTNERIRVDLTLEVGAITEQVRVTAEALLLQTANANLGQVIDARRVAELPLHDGSPYSILYFTPGVSDSGAGRVSQDPQNYDGASQGISVNGTPMGTTSFMIDGTVNTQIAHGIGPMNSPPADLVEELKVETAFDASVGHTAGLVVNVALKTGTNTAHGSAYGFVRDPEWNANTFFSNRAGLPRVGFPYKHWGATLTGPVYIPKIFNGKNRTFFSYGYDHVRDNTGDAAIASVPIPHNATANFPNFMTFRPRHLIS